MIPIKSRKGRVIKYQIAATTPTVNRPSACAVPEA